MRLRIIRADLHIHTCLSPCGSLEMGPRTIVNEAIRRNLDVIGIADHNSSENSLAVMRAARGRNLTVLPGMEVASKEEVHILALFDGMENGLRLQEIAYTHLPGENDEEAFGLQVVVNEDHDVVGYNQRFLAGATELPVDQIVDRIHGLGGLAIASHVDRDAFGIIGQLGFIPDGLKLDALELSPNTSLAQARQRFHRYSRFALVRFSDAHCPADIGKASTSFLLESPSIAEFKKAFCGEDGRRLLPDDAAPGEPEKKEQDWRRI